MCNCLPWYAATAAITARNARSRNLFILVTPLSSSPTCLRAA
jgi:hypothetical protein